jgi:hypothetical membrane protein
MGHVRPSSGHYAEPPAPAAARSAPARWLALGAAAGPVLFTLDWLVLGFLSPGFTIFGARISPYSPISAGISGLGLGPTGPWMNAVFVVTGVLLIVGVAAAFRGLEGGRRWVCTGLLALPGVGAIIDGFFTLESPGPHYTGALLGFGSPVVTFLVTGLLLRRVAGWQRVARWLLVASPVTLVLLVLYFVTFSPTAQGAEHGIAGLMERLLITEVLTMFVVLGWTGFREPSGELDTRAATTGGGRAGR